MAGRAKRTRKDHDESELRDPAWERQRWETSPGYDRFRAYRDVGPTRSYARIAEAFGVSVTTVTAMAQSNLWVERARRWDAHLDTIGRVESERAARDAAAENARRVGAMQAAEWEIWEEAKATVLDLLALARSDPRAAGQAAQLLREANRVARMATGQPTEGARPKADETGRESDLDAFLDQLAGGAGSAVPGGNTSAE